MGRPESTATGYDPSVLLVGILEHHGIKGMKWGAHKEREPLKQGSSSHTFKTSSGESMTLEGMKTPVLGRTLAHVFPAIRNKINNSDAYAIKNGNGDRVGEMYTRKDPDEKNALNVVWIETKKEHKGNGYATATMSKAIDIAKHEGRDKVTLEVPGISPDARHIYEKLGFKDKGGYKDYDPNDIWGGLTKMELTLPSSKVKHNENLVCNILMHHITGVEMPDDTAAHGAAFTSEFLAHHGVKGMKWGSRKGSTSSPHPPSDDHITVEAHKAKIKSSGVKALSNDELNKVVERMNLEQRHRDLVDKQPSKFTNVEKGDAHVKKVLKVGKTMAEVYNLVNSPAGKAAKVAVKKLAK